MFVDKDSDFDPDVADCLSNSTKQVCKTNQQDSVQMTDSFHSLWCWKYTSDTSDIPFFVFYWLLKDSEWMMMSTENQAVLHVHFK